MVVVVVVVVVTVALTLFETWPVKSDHDVVGAVSELRNIRVIDVGGRLPRSEPGAEPGSFVPRYAVGSVPCSCSASRLRPRQAPAGPALNSFFFQPSAPGKATLEPQLLIDFVPTSSIARPSRQLFVSSDIIQQTCTCRIRNNAPNPHHRVASHSFSSIPLARATSGTAQARHAPPPTVRVSFERFPIRKRRAQPNHLGHDTDIWGHVSYPAQTTPDRLPRYPRRISEYHRAHPSESDRCTLLGRSC